MASFKLYASQTGFKAGGVTYTFEHPVSLAVDDPERNQLTRGLNTENTVGLDYRDGLNEPKRWTLPFMGMTPELKAVLDNCYKNRTRIDVFVIMRDDGSAKWMRQAILANRPQQMNLDQSAESLQVNCEFISFDTDEVHKS